MALAADALALERQREPGVEGDFARLVHVVRPVLGDLFRADRRLPPFQDAVDRVPVFVELALLGVGRHGEIAGGRVPFVGQARGDAGPPGLGLDQPAIGIGCQLRRALQLQGHIDEPEQRARAARGVPGLRGGLARMVQQQDRHPRGRQAVQRLQGFEQRGRVRFAAAGEERGERIDDEQVEAEVDGAADEVVPFPGRRPAAEGPGEQMHMRADRHQAGALGPLRARFFGDDPNARRLGVAAEERRSGPEAAEHPGQQRGLAGLPLAREQGDVAGLQVAVPEPVHLFGDSGFIQGVETDGL